MLCSDFKNKYSDFRDGLMGGDSLHNRMKAHLRSCDHCARHDKALRVGIREIQRLPTLQTEPWSHVTTAKKAMAGDTDPVMPAHGGLLVGAMLAAALALFIFEDSTPPFSEPVASVPAPRVPIPQVLAAPINPILQFSDGPSILRDITPLIEVENEEETESPEDVPTP